MLGLSRSNDISLNKILNIKGGYGPTASEDGGDYYAQFPLDYGKKDRLRIAGALRGFVKATRLVEQPEKDLFLQWMNKYLANGPQPISGRLKPFYVHDFGSKKDLQRGENPKIIIVNRKLDTDDDKILLNPSKEVDVEVRDIWQPWLKSRCNFALRYIVPNRENILKIMAAQGKFTAQVVLDSDEEGKDTLWNEMIFRPRIASRLLGKRSKSVFRELDPSLLSNSRAMKSMKNTEKQLLRGNNKGNVLKKKIQNTKTIKTTTKVSKSEQEIVNAVVDDAKKDVKKEKKAKKEKKVETVEKDSLGTKSLSMSSIPKNPSMSSVGIGNLKEKAQAALKDKATQLKENTKAKASARSKSEEE